MNDIDKRDGIQEIIDNAIREMGFDRRNGDFRPKSVNLAEFCRKTGLTRSKARTLQKKAFVAVHGNCGKKRETTVIAGFEGELDALLRKGVTNSSVALERIQAKGYAGGLTMVKAYLHDNAHLVPAPRRAVAGDRSRGQRYETGPGEAYQMDWGFVDAEDPAGNVWPMACLVVVCHHCGTFYIEFFPNARQENLFIGMVHAFMAMGVPAKVLTDNMKSVVTRRDHEGRPVWNREYEAFMEAVGFKTRLCKPYHPWTKGKAERLVRFVKGNFLAGRTFTDITDLNGQALEWCAKKALRLMRPPGVVPAEEHASACLPSSAALVETTEVAMYLCPERKISFDGFVSYEGRRFGVPYWYEGRSCRVNRDGEWLHVYSSDMSVELAVHAVTWGRRDSTCPGQWAEAPCPEELPTSPVTTTVLQIEAPTRPGGIERFDFERRLS
jgi:transposase